jgi:MbtH protein
MYIFNGVKTILTPCRPGLLDSQYKHICACDIYSVFVAISRKGVRRGMSEGEQEDTTIYTVVVNHEEQYSIWPVYRDLPPGWKAAGKSGLKSECLAYIKEVWTDMRPLSLRKQMDAADQSISLV